MEELKVDVVVIGSGPAGQKAAIQASKLGKTVIVIEKAPEPGGSCLYSGTIPSKSLREAIIEYIILKTGMTREKALEIAKDLDKNGCLFS